MSEDITELSTAAARAVHMLSTGTVDMARAWIRDAMVGIDPRRRCVNDEILYGLVEGLNAPPALLPLSPAITEAVVQVALDMTGEGAGTLYSYTVRYPMPFAQLRLSRYTRVPAQHAPSPKRKHEGTVGRRVRPRTE